MNPFVFDVSGRKAELQVLASLLDGATERGGTTALVGEPGIGKSTLLRAAARHAAETGFEVLEAAGVESESGLPFAGLHHLLLPALDGLEELPHVQRRALSSAFGLEEGPAPDPFLIALAALNLLTEAASTRPVLLVVDDVQWLDGPSQSALTFIARRVSRDPIAVLGAFRPGHAGPFAAAGFPELTVRGLDEAAAREILEAHAGDLGVADREEILRTSLGNPLALVELPVAWRTSRHPSAAGGPEFLPLTARLERAFAGRIPALPAATRDVVLVAAVASQAELAETLAAASVLREGAVTVNDLEPAAEAGLLWFDEARIAFRHPLARSGVVLSETVGRRQSANAALAHVIADDEYRRTWHLAHSILGPDDAVAEQLENGHTIALRRGSVISAIWTLERSAQLTTDPALRGRRLLRAAEHAFGLGRVETVERLLAEASDTDLSDLDTARMEWLREIFSDGSQGDVPRVLELCDSALGAAHARDTDLALNLLLGAGLRCWWAETGPASRARVTAVLDELGDVADDPRHLAALACAEPVLRGGEVCAKLARIAAEKITDPDALRLLGMAAHAVGDQVRAAAFLGRAESRLRERGQLGLLPHVLGMQCPVHLDLGDWDRIEAAFGEGRRAAEETGQALWSAGMITNEVRLIALRGETGRALTLADEVFQHPLLRQSNDFMACAQLARGYALLSAGRHSDALDALLRAYDPTDCSYHQRERMAGVMFVAEAAMHAGRVPEGRAVLTGMEAVAELTPSPLLHVQLRYARAVLADDDDAEALFRLALAADDLPHWPWVRARTELAYGSWLRRRRRVVESRAPLRSARATFDVIGATSWSRQALAELRATGERHTTRGDTPKVVLSPQELQIARLAAQGLSNREIGQRLFLSHRTIGSHLYRIFPKLGITARSQLADRLGPNAEAAQSGALPG